MNRDQQENIAVMTEELSKALCAAWSYLHLLRGLHEGGRDNPLVLNRFWLLFDQLWRAAFEGFYAKAGTTLDKSKSNYSLPNLVKLIKRYGDTELRSLLPEVEACLNEADSPLLKIRNWRNKAVAHRTDFARDPEYYTANKLRLDDVEDALAQLDRALNHLSSHLLSRYIDTRTGSLRLIEDGRSLFNLLAMGIQEESKAASHMT
jgi:hypothetical protein